MQITILNGSPKGKTSITMQYLSYVKSLYPQYDFNVVDVSEQIKPIEENKIIFNEIIKQIRLSDAVLWASPVYYNCVPAQLKRFVELIRENKKHTAFSNKYTAVLSTSTYIFDHIAHRYLNAVCDDLNMKYIGFFSAEMGDLLNEEGRKKLETFSENFFQSVENKISPTKNFNSIPPSTFFYKPGKPQKIIDTDNKKILVVFDGNNRNVNIQKMIDFFLSAYNQELELLNLSDINIQGGCRGSLKCMYNNTCSYEGIDDFTDIYRSKIMTADILIFAGEIKDRFLSSTWKLFFDRSMFMGHVPSLKGKQIGYIISGSLRQIPNVRDFIETAAELQMANLVGIITDEDSNSKTIDNCLQDFAQDLVYFSGKNYVNPPTFLGIAGTKMLKHIVERNRFLFQADHKAYKHIDTYELPSINFVIKLKNAILAPLLRIPKIRKIFNKKIKELLIMPHKKILKKYNKL